MDDRGLGGQRPPPRLGGKIVELEKITFFDGA